MISIVNFDLSIVNFDFSIVNVCLSIVNFCLSIVNFDVSIVNSSLLVPTLRVAPQWVTWLTLSSLSGVKFCFDFL